MKKFDSMLIKKFEFKARTLATRRMSWLSKYRYIYEHAKRSRTLLLIPNLGTAG